MTDPPELIRACELIRGARLLRFLRFGYHDTNIERLKTNRDLEAFGSDMLVQLRQAIVRAMTFRQPETTAVCAALVAATLLFAFDPVTTWWFPSCPFHAWTGWLCPFCGSLRALHALLHGEPRVALELNFLTIVGLTASLLALAHDVVYPTRATAFERLTGVCLSARGLALIVAFGIFRNLHAPFGWIVH